MFCSNCGTKIDDPKSTYCPNCGSHLTGESKQVSSTPEATPATAKETMTLEQVRSRVETYLREAKIIYQVQAGGALAVRHGTTAVFINLVKPSDRTYISLAAPVARDITKITPELTRFIAEQNDDLLFGKFTLNSKNMIVWFKHALLGDFLDPEELIWALAVVASTADNNDERVTEMAGGKRLVDK